RSGPPARWVPRGSRARRLSSLVWIEVTEPAVPVDGQRDAREGVGGWGLGVGGWVLVRTPNPQPPTPNARLFDPQHRRVRVGGHHGVRLHHVVILLPDPAAAAAVRRAEQAPQRLLWIDR